MTHLEVIQRLYIGFFGRPADFDGLAYWDKALAAGGNAQLLSAAFAASPEFQALAANPATMVNQIYLHAFGRAAEADGLSYWTRQLESGAVSAAAVVDAVLAGARGADSLALAGKVAAASAFTAASALYPAVIGGAASEGARWLLSVSADARSLDSALSSLIPENPGAIATQAATSDGIIQQLHIGYFGRPADTTTIAMLQRAQAEGNTLEGLRAQFFSKSAEFLLQAAKGNAQLVDYVYGNLFGHAADAAGSAYWVGRLDDGSLGLDTLVDALISAAGGSDAVALGHKTIAATAHAEMAVRAGEWMPLWPAVVIGPIDPPVPSKWLAQVTQDPASLDVALENLYELYSPPQSVVTVGVPGLESSWL